MRRLALSGSRNMPMCLTRGARIKRPQPPPAAAAAAAGTKKSKRRSRRELLEEVVDLAPAAAAPVAGALLRNKQLVEEAEEMGKYLDTEGEDDEFLKEATVTSDVLDLPLDEASASEQEAKHFQSFFGRDEPMYLEDELLEADDDGDAEEAEVKRKLGSDAVASERVADLREREEQQGRRNVVLDGVRGNVTEKRPGFERRGRRDTLEEQQENATRERARQLRVHTKDDVLRVGDVAVPPHLEKWVLDPTGDHKQRHKKQRIKEERLAKWHAEHGIYYQQRRQSGFRRDPVNTDMTVRQQRVSQLIHEAVQKVFAEDFEHEYVPEFQVEKVEMAVDMKRVKIMWGTEEQVSQVQSFLRRMTPTIRRLLTARVQLKFSPVVEFVYTDFEKKRLQMDRIMHEIDPLAGEELDGEEGEGDGELDVDDFDDDWEGMAPRRPGEELEEEEGEEGEEGDEEMEGEEEEWEDEQELEEARALRKRALEEQGLDEEELEMLELNEQEQDDGRDVKEEDNDDEDGRNVKEEDDDDSSSSSNSSSSSSSSSDDDSSSSSSDDDYDSQVHDLDKDEDFPEYDPSVKKDEEFEAWFKAIPVITTYVKKGKKD